MSWKNGRPKSRMWNEWEFWHRCMCMILLQSGYSIWEIRGMRVFVC